MPRPLTIGVAFELSRVPQVHIGEHDLALDYVVTQNGIFRSEVRA